MTLFVQGSGKPFGPELIREFERPECRRVDIAVAWVRASGLRHLQKAMVDALGRDVLIRVVVGIDADNTSYEGLKGLIDIAATGPANAMTLVVRHNEAGHIFHPKMYAFRTDDELRLFAGSNNMTQAGLFQNEELSYRAKRTLPNKLATDLDAFFASLMPPGGGLSKTLDAAFLDSLRDKGYVSGEQRLRAKASAKTATKRKEPLFGRVGRGAPALPAAPVAAAPLPVPIVPDPPTPMAGDLDWQRLVVRLRISRGTQGQIPIEIFREMRRRANQTGDDDVLILKKIDGTERRISKSRKGAGGADANTYKIEALAQNEDPILHVYPVGNDLYYEIFSGLTGVGLGLLQHLEAGFDTDPPKSFFTRNPKDTATWWRFD